MKSNNSPPVDPPQPSPDIAPQTCHCCGCPCCGHQHARRGKEAGRKMSEGEAKVLFYKGIRYMHY